MIKPVQKIVVLFNFLKIVLKTHIEDLTRVVISYEIEPCHEKTNVLVSDVARYKRGCTATEDG